MTYFYCKKLQVSSAPVFSKFTFSRYSYNIKKKEERTKTARCSFIILNSPFLFRGKKGKSIKTLSFVLLAEKKGAVR
jgi:hypothetical protein